MASGKQQRQRVGTIALPIVAGTFAVAATIAVLVGWNIIFTRYYLDVAQARSADSPGAGYWILLSIGDAALVFAIVTMIVFLVRNVRQVLELRRQTTFIDSIGHELRTPLASLRLGVEALASPAMDDRTRERFVHNMTGDVDRLERFITHLLHAGRLEHGEQRVAPTPVALAPIVEECVEQVRGRYAERNARFEVDETGLADAFVLADPHVLQIALLNVLDNAVKYSPETPAIRVRLERSGRRTWLHVTDRGAGLSPATQKRIFSRFYRGDLPISRMVKGTGLGLHVSRELLRLMGGDMRASSNGPEQGSTFSIGVPAAPEDTSR